MRLSFPSPEFIASLDAGRISRPSSALPELEVVTGLSTPTRRGFLSAVSCGLAAFGASSVGAQERGQLIFAPDDDPAQPAHSPLPQNLTEHKPLAIGQIPEDFWYRPRELWLRRGKEQARLVYWQDGQLVSDGYWRACAMLRDIRANRMTTIDPAILDVLRGITGYYQAWRWPHPVVVTSGYRTPQTNAALSREGAARNSLHLYGRAVDIVVPGVPARDVSALARGMRQGGVGFYPSRQFTHADTGRLRTWRG